MRQPSTYQLHARGNRVGVEFVAVRSTASAGADGLFGNSAHVSTKVVELETCVLCSYCRFKMGWLTYPT